MKRYYNARQNGARPKKNRLVAWLFLLALFGILIAFKPEVLIYPGVVLGIVLFVYLFKRRGKIVAYFKSDKGTGGKNLEVGGKFDNGIPSAFRVMDEEYLKGRGGKN